MRLSDKPHGKSFRLPLGFSVALFDTLQFCVENSILLVEFVLCQLAIVRYIMAKKETPNLHALMVHIATHHRLDKDAILRDDPGAGKSTVERQLMELQHQHTEMCAALGRIADQLAYSNRCGCIGNRGKLEGAATDMVMRALCLAMFAGLSPEDLVTRIEAVSGLRIGEVESE